VSTLPTLIAECGFTGGASTSTYLHLDDVARGKLGTATLGPDAVWTDVTAYVWSASTQRGASRAESPVLHYDAGTATVALDNSDRRFDPTNLTGPYVAAGATEVTPMRAVRLRATWAGVTYDLWRGYADSWGITYNGPNWSQCTLTATDGFKVLSNYDRIAVSAVGAGEAAGTRIGRVLDSVSWSATDRVIATGDTTLQATTLDGDALTEMYLDSDTEIGELYMDGAGRVVFRNRQALLEDARSNTPQATFGDSGTELPYTSVTIAYDEATLANLVQVGRVGGTVQVSQDVPSQNTYLTRTFNRTDLLMQTDAAAAEYAGFIKFVGKDPELRFATLVVNPLADAAHLFPQVLSREIGDRVTINRRPPGGGTITRDVFIRGIQHDITPATWLTTWTLQSASKYSFLVLGDPTLGLLDSNALAY
jgi:hypothetical protein